MDETKIDRAPEPPPLDESSWTDVLQHEGKYGPDSYPADYVHQLEQRASVDALTGVGTYRKMKETMTMLERQHERNVGFLFLDGNNFGQINKTLTHEYGDAYIKQTAKLLTSNLDAEKSNIFRVGGDEFVVILFGLDKQDDVDAVGLRLADVFQGGNFPDGKPIPTMSIGGVCIGEAMSDADLSSAIIGANVAMKDAKQQQKELPKISTMFGTPDGNVALDFLPTGYQPFRKEVYGPLWQLPRPQILAK